MTTAKRTVLITGCSDDGLGAALAIALHKAGLHVYATARNTSKLGQVKAAGIETLQLDVTDDQSIASCVSKVPNLDILINNAGASGASTFADMSIPDAKTLFDLNVWSVVKVTQAFLPLLLQSKGMIVNHTSITGIITLPFQSVYSASKAALAAITQTLRLELSLFDIKVVELKSGAVTSNFLENQKETPGVVVPKGSIYSPIKDSVEHVMSLEALVKDAPLASDWASGVCHDLLKTNPPLTIWRGASAGQAKWSTVLPDWAKFSIISSFTGLSKLKTELQANKL